MTPPERLQDVTLAERLRDALRVLADYPLEDFSKEGKPDGHGLFGANDWNLTVGHVKAARSVIAEYEAAAALSVRGDEFPLYEFTTLLMCSDPWPVTDVGHGTGEDAIEALADAEARKAGFDGWIDAYHQLKAPRTKP